MPGYAAIRINRNTLGAILHNAVEAPSGTEKLAWALLQHPYKESEELFYVGGNYLHKPYVDFSKQILTRAQLDELFTYRKADVEKRLGPKPNGDWFVVTVREDQDKLAG